MQQQFLEYRGFELAVERIPQGWRIKISSPKHYVPHYLQQVTKAKKDDAIAEAKSMVDHLIGQ